MTTNLLPATRPSFHLWLALALASAVFLGFWFTYFGPIFGGTYPPARAIVHVHGWSFFLWYLLLIVQTGLIASGRVRVHRTLGLASIALATVMITVGLIVSTVRVDMALHPPGDPFWGLMGLPIFSIWVLFAVFYAAAILRRRRSPEHKRLMVLASAVAMSAATFRIFVQVLGFRPWVAVVGTLAPGLFVAAAMLHDRARLGEVHRVYRWGLPLMLGVVGGMFVLALTPGGDGVKRGVAWIGRLLQPLY